MKLTYNNIADYTAQSTFPIPGTLFDEIDKERLAPDSGERFYPTETHKYQMQLGERLPRSVTTWMRSTLQTMPKGITKKLSDAQLDALKQPVDPPTNQGWAGQRETRDYPLTPDECAATVLSEINRTKELAVWKETQATIRRAQSHKIQIDTRKVTGTDGKRRWQDARVYELPPLTHSKLADGIEHVPARYIIRCPDGRLVDLGKPEGNFAPLLQTSPDRAMQSIASRLRLRVKGGATTILNTIIGAKPVLDDDKNQCPAFLPAYTTVWMNGHWTVAVGWMKNPKITKGTYEIDDDNNLHRSKHGDTTSVSKIEYAIIAADSISEEDEQSDTVDGTMELDAELVQQGFERDGERFDVDSDQFTDGLILLEEAAKRMSRRNDFLAGDAVWTRDDFRETLAEMGRETIAMRHHLLRQIRSIRSTITREMFQVPKDPMKIIELTQQRDRLKFRAAVVYREWRAQLADMWEQLNHHIAPVIDNRHEAWLSFRPRVTGENADGSLNWTEPHLPTLTTIPPTQTAGAIHWSDSGYTPAPPNSITPATGAHQAAISVLKRGCDTLVPCWGGLYRISVPDAPKVPLDAHNATSKLKDVIRKQVLATRESDKENVRIITPRKQAWTKDARRPLVKWGMRHYNPTEGHLSLR